MSLCKKCKKLIPKIEKQMKSMCHIYLKIL